MSLRFATALGILSVRFAFSGLLFVSSMLHRNCKHAAMGWHGLIGRTEPVLMTRCEVSARLAACFAAVCICTTMCTDDYEGPVRLVLMTLLDPVIALMGQSDSLASFFEDQCERQAIPTETIAALSTSGAFDTIDFLKTALEDAAAANTTSVSICMDRSGNTASRLECAVCFHALLLCMFETLGLFVCITARCIAISVKVAQLC